MRRYVNALSAMPATLSERRLLLLGHRDQMVDRGTERANRYRSGSHFHHYHVRGSSRILKYEVPGVNAEGRDWRGRHPYQLFRHDPNSAGSSRKTEGRDIGRRVAFAQDLDGT